MSQPSVTIVVELPHSPVTNPGVDDLNPSYFDVRITSGSSYLPVGIYDAWCADVNSGIPLNASTGLSTSLTAYIYSSYETGLIAANLPGIGNTYNLDLVNWMLNQDFTSSGYTYGEIQCAIWTLLGDTNFQSEVGLGTVDPAHINALVALATADSDNNGVQDHEGFVPDVTQNIAVILDPVSSTGTHYQPLIITTKAAALGDYVWIDGNANGRQDANEQGLGGVTVNLVRDINNDGDFNDANELLKTTVTDATGYYEFKGLTPGLDYQVQFVQPAGYQFTQKDVVSNTFDATDSDANTATGVTGIVLLHAGEFNHTIDAGLYQTASLGDRLWVDTNGDGIQNDGATGLSGRTVTLIGGGADGLINGVGDTTATTTTGADGFYQFTGLTPGVEYQVQFGDLPAGYQFTGQNLGGDDTLDSDANSAGFTQIVTLASGENNPTLDAGVYQTASLGDRLWVDTNGDGIQNDGATGLSGRTVTLIGGGADGLINGVGDTTATTTTGADGFYQFTGLTPGVEYQVQFGDLPAGYQLTGQNLGGDDTLDSDANAAGFTQIVTLASGENNPTLDAGVYQTASLGDRLWVDTNGDGIQNDGATGLSGRTVTLIGGGADGLINGVGDTTATTTTGADGFYQFTGLTPGAEYQVQFGDLPAGYQLTGQNLGGDDTLDSDANAAGYTQIVTLASGENNPTLDAGVYQTASLGDRLWVDTNGDGIQNDGATGLSGRTVTLIGGGADGLINGVGDTTATTTTGADGFYQFTGLTPGVEYQVQFGDLPAGYQFTGQNLGGDDTLDSDANAAGFTQIVTLASGENNPTLDAGVYQTASLGDRLWVDTNGDGIQNDGATGLSGRTVTLIGGGADGLINGVGDTTATTTTGADGFYQFTGLTPGVEYQVQFGDLPAGYQFTGQNLGGDDTLDSDANAAGYTQIVTLASGENNPTLDAGVYQTASLGDRLWVDTNGDGIQNDGATGLSGRTVTLIGGGADGLINGVGDTTATTTTGADGFYQFTGLTPGVEYQVQFGDLPAGYQITGQNLGGDDTLDSDANAAGFTQIVTLASGENNPTLDAGVYQTASLGDRLWVDTNGDGIQNDGATGLSGRTVTLIGGGADGLINGVGDTTATTTTGGDGFYQFTGLTPGVEYQVQFGDLPAGYQFAGQNLGGDDTLDSDANAAGITQIVTLASGENNPTLDAGVYQTASLGDRLWVDTNGDGIQNDGATGLSGRTVTLIGGGADGLINGVGDTTATTTTGADGFYQFTGLTPGVEYQVQFGDLPAGYQFAGQNLGGDDTLDSDANAAGFTQIVTLASGENNPTLDAGVHQTASLGDRLWVDTNGDGIQNDGATGLSGRTVTLIGGGADGLINGVGDTTATTTTGADGFYQFTGLTPGVEYQVQFGDLPAGYQLTGQNLGGDDTLDSDANAAGITQIVTLASGENNPTLDAGVYQTASLGDRLWVDTNGDGIQNDGATGLSGRTVTLIGGGADGLINGVGDTTATTTTGADGFYQFTGLTPGVEYQVQFGDLPAGYQFTGQNLGGDDTLDSDANASGFTQIVTLASGENNPTLDAGVYQTASLGDRLWVDTNGDGIQNDGATGLSGRTVTLIGGGADGLINGVGDTTATTTTGADGFYQFTGLTPGVQYQVQFGDIPSGYQFTGQDQGGNDATDSDANALGYTQIVTLASGENNPTLDAGLLATVQNGDLSIVKSDGLTTVSPGQNITYTIVVTNNGPGNVANALVTDNFPSQLTGVTWTSVASAGATDNQLAGSGNISDYVSMAAGSTITYTVNATVAAGAITTKVSDFAFGANNTNLGQSITVNGVTAEAFYISSGYKTTNTVLWERNVTDDHGIGVWSNGEPDPVVNGGDVNEISNQLNNEVIRLTKADADQWTSLWVSSLDSGGSGGAETGTVYWSNSATPDLSALTTKFTFHYGDFGPNEAEGDILTLNPAGFDASAKYVFFVAGPNAAGTNNDYLVWKASTANALLTNTATVTPPATFNDTNPGNNASTDTDTLAAQSALGDFVWNDFNANGIQDDGESGIAGVSVKLLNSSGTVLATTTTDASGHYLFNNLSAGDYKVQVVAPGGYYTSPKDQGGNDATDSDIDATGTTALVSLPAGVTNLTLDAGLYQKASIGDRVWLDANGNGIQDAGETGLSGVTVKLLNGSGSVLATTTTNASGNYLFSGLNPGDYAIQVVPPAGLGIALKDQGGNDAADSDIDGVTGRTAVTTLSSGENDLTWDAGLTSACACMSLDFSGTSSTYGSLGNIRGYNFNGLQVNVSAFSRDKTSAAWASAYVGAYGGGLGVTDSGEGSGGNNTHTVDNTGGRDNYLLFEFSQLVQLDSAFLGYVVNDSDLQVWIGTFNQPVSNHLTLSSSVLAGMGFSEVNTTTLTGTRWADLNAGGVYGNVIVIAADTTDTTPEDMFKVQILNLCTPCNGLKASLGDLVWHDLNANGVQDAGESGMSGVTVKLLDSAGTLLATTTTDSSGHYLFSGLDGGDYKVQVAAPSGYTAAPKDQGGDDSTDSDIDAGGTTAVVSLTGGTDNLSVDAGLYQKASIGDRVWQDTNGNGIQDAGEAGVSGVTVKLLNAGGSVVATTSTNASGNYLFSGLTPGDYAIQVVAPAGMSISAKDQGTNDAADSDVDPVSGKTVLTTLTSGENDLSWDAGLLNACACMNLDFSGSSSTYGTLGNMRSFNFDGMNVNVTAFSRDKSSAAWASAYVGSYGGGLGVTDSGEGSGGSNTHTVDNTGGRDNYLLFEFSQLVQLDQAFLGYVVNDSDMQVWIGTASNPISNHITLSDSVLAGMGFSEVNTTTLTSARWADLNAGGLFGNVIVIAADTTDTTPEDMFKVQTLTVCTASATLKGSLGDFVWHDLNGNGVQDTGESGLSGVTVKLLSAAGTLLATTTTDSTGHYLFSNLNPGDYKVQVVAPSGYYVSPKDQGGNDATDSDMDSAGTTAVITLNGGTDNLSVDAGLFKKASIGDRVWNDADRDGYQDSGETGISGVHVDLKDANGNIIAGTNTDSYGNYKFTGLNPGTYMIDFMVNSLPSGYSVTKQNYVSDNNKDSDANLNDGITAYTTLISGQVDNSWDMGAYSCPIVVDLNGDGVKTLGLSAGVQFDMDNDGTRVATGWLSAQDGFLVHDDNHSGTIESRAEMFGGDNPGDGFRQLALLDANGDGKLDAADAGYADLAIWQDANSNGLTDAGELSALIDHGIVSLDLDFESRAGWSGGQQNGNVLMDWSSATQADGNTADLVDAFFVRGDAADALAALFSDAAPEIEQLLANLGAAPADAGSAPAADAAPASELAVTQQLLPHLEHQENWALAA